MNLAHITANFSGRVRHDRMEDRDYLVGPMVMITEGVHSGSQGPTYYPYEELERRPWVWNHKPVVVYHPMANGGVTTACEPDTLTMSKVGVIMRTRFEEGKLKAEAWLDEARVRKIDSRIMDTIDRDKVMELSTGLYSDTVRVNGEFKGKKYERIARNIQPDHLALLPDQKGACSVDDGAGFLQVNAEYEGPLLMASFDWESEEQEIVFAHSNVANDGPLVMPVMNFEPETKRELVDVGSDDDESALLLPQWD